MVFDGIDFHNVAEMNVVDGQDGMRLQRVPEEVRQSLSEGGQTMLLSPVANVEIRFLLIGDGVDITLSAGSPDGLRMYVYWSGFQERAFYEIGEKATTIHLAMEDRYARLDPDHCRQTGYSKNLVRLMFMGNPDVPLFYHGITGGEIAPPQAEDVRPKRLMAYGTSITHGGKMSAPHLTYAYQTAHNLGMDLLNYGAAGTAFCEKAMADYLGKQVAWDVAVLSISVNMYCNENFTLDDFRQGSRYMIEQVAKNNPSKPVFCITMYPFFDDLGVYNPGSEKNAEDYRQALRDNVRSLGLENVYLLEGRDMLTDITLLAPDLIHPNDMGMVQMGQNLAAAIREYGVE